MATYEDLLKQGYTSSYQKEIEEAMKNKPTYVNGREQQLNDLYTRISNRSPFAYDLNGDALYQQYKNQYQTLGKQAMKDTMGQAAGLTGGYGSTYSQSVGQQAYNAYLQQLNNIVPDLYDRAYGRYNQETQDLYNLYGMERDLENQEYGRFQDSLSDYWTNLNYLQSADNTGYSRQQDYYNRLVSLMTQAGYNPTDEDLAAAGMTRAQADAYRSYYAQQQAAISGGGGGGGRSYGGGGYSYGGSSGGTSGSSSTKTSSTASITPPEERVGNDYSIRNVTNNAVSGGSVQYTSLYAATNNIVIKSGKPSLRVVSTAADGGAGYFYDSKTQRTYKATSMEDAAAQARKVMAGMVLTESAWNKNKQGYNSYNAYLSAYTKWATS